MIANKLVYKCSRSSTFNYMEINMFATLEFVMVAALFADLLMSRGAQLLVWVKGAGATVAADAKKL